MRGIRTLKSANAGMRAVKRAVKAVVEQLEQRQLLTSVYWDGGGNDYDWATAANWSNDQVPTASDDVVIDVPGNITVTVGQEQEVHSLRLNDSLNVTGGIYVGGGMEVNGTLTVAGWLCFLTDGSITGSGNLVLQNGRFSGSGIVTIGQNVTLSGNGYFDWGVRNEGTMRGCFWIEGYLSNAGLFEAEGGESDINSLPENTGTIITKEGSEIFSVLDLMYLAGGTGTPLSATELAVNLQAPPVTGRTYTYELAVNGGAYQSHAADSLFAGLKKGIDYQVRITATDPNGGKIIYESAVLRTLAEPDKTVTRYLIGYADEYGNMFTRFAQPVAVDAGSAMAASFEVARTPHKLQNGVVRALVQDGSVPSEEFGYRLYVHDGSTYSFDPYSLGIYHYATSEGFATSDPSAQQSLSGPYYYVLTPVWDWILPPGTCQSGTGGADPASGAAWSDPSDLQSYGLGSSFTSESHWTSDGNLLSDDRYGSGTVGDGIPTLLLLNQDYYYGPSTVVVVFDSRNTLAFNRVGTGSTYQAFGSTDSLVHSGSQFIYRTADGATIGFNDFSVSQVNKRGQFVSRTDASGNTTTVSAWTAGGMIAEIRRRAAGAANDGESWLYTYVQGGENDGKVASVQLRRPDGLGGWTAQRTAQYSYYADTDANGSAGDRKYVTIREGGLTGPVIETKYYRYYTEGEEDGFVHGLKYFFDGASYARLAQYAAAHSKTVDDITDEETFVMANGLTSGVLHAFANDYYEYDGQRRCVTHSSQTTGCSGSCGGVGTNTYQYFTNAAYPENLSDPETINNTWYFKTIETLNDGNVNIYYMNLRGEVMLKLFWNKVDGVTPDLQGKVWGTFYRYDAEGREIWQANPSAIGLSITATTDGELATALAGSVEQYPDLMHAVSGNYAYLNDNSGEINVTDYYASTTAGETTAGGVLGYVQDHKLKHGELGTGILLDASDYFAHVSGDITIYPVAHSTVYENEDGTGGRTSSYNYGWTGTHMDWQTVTNPIVSTDHNGSGSATSGTQWYDALGRVAWEQDAAGYLAYTQYDDATGAVVKRIVDVDTSLGGYLGSAPVTRTGGLHLVSTYEVDDQGRVTKETDPAGRVTYTVYNDLAQEVRAYRGWNAQTHRPTGPIEITRQDRAHGYTEFLTSSATPTLDGNNLPTGQEVIAAANIQSLSRSILNEGGQRVEADAYVSLSGITYSQDDLRLGSAGTNYQATLYGYEKRGRLTRTVNPDGTVSVVFFDGEGHVRQVWQGTDDVPTDDWLADGILDWRDFRKWVSSNPTAVTGPAGTNMVKIAEYEYDNMTVGDGNRTKSTARAGAGQADRVTVNLYDWRDRLVSAKNGVEESEDESTNRPLTIYSYDNLGEITRRDVYDGDGVSMADADGDGVPDALVASRLRARSESRYDEMGRVYQMRQYSVDQSTGEVGDPLVSDSWYDPRGYLIKSRSANGRVTKNWYDGAGRNWARVIGDGGGDVSYADASDIDGDTILESYGYNYDNSGNLVLTTRRQRFHDATGTGLLGDPNSTELPKARVSYVANWYDLAGRLVVSVDLGTYGGDSYTWQDLGTIPGRSDTALRTDYSYDDAGYVRDVTDPRGIVTRSEYDPLGRLTRKIEAYVDGVPSNADDRITEYTYDGAGHVLTMTARLPNNAFQTTQYIYGASQARGDDIDSNDILVAIRYPDKTTGEPSASEQETYTVNALGEMKTKEDRNGTVHEYGRDVLGRLTDDTVTTLGSGVDDAVLRLSYTYNVLGEIESATSYSDTAGTQVVNQVKREYNGLGQLIAEWQEHSGAVDLDSLKVQYSYDLANGGRLTSMTYPNGRVISYNYTTGIDDTISRLSSISDSSGTLEGYTYLGLDTVVARTRPQPGVDLSYIKRPGESDGEAGDQYIGLDRFGRTADQRWTNASGTDVDRYQYGYDRNSNALYKNNLLSSANSELYHANSTTSGDNNSAYDPLNRLTDFRRGTLSSSGNNGSGLDQVVTASRTQDWDLDASGNWDQLTTNGIAEDRTHNAQNEATQVGTNTLAYDDNGNTITDQAGRSIVYDAWNHIISVVNLASYRRMTYSYDAFGRRVTECEEPWGGNSAVLVVNDGTVQRSAVVSLTLVFSQQVTLQTGALELVKRGGSAVSFTVANPSGDGRTYVFTFTGSDLENGSLPDGIYDLTIHGAYVLDSGGIPLGTDQAFAFHRLLGDVNGNRMVSSQDVILVRNGKAPANYCWYYDLDSDGAVTSADSDIVRDLQFTSVSSYTPGIVVSGPVSTSAAPGFDRVYNQSLPRDLYYSSAWQVVEERSTNVETLDVTVSSQYVWSSVYVDAMIERDRDTNGDGTLEERLYVLQDANWNTTGIVESTGVVKERYIYDPYGSVTALSDTWYARPSSNYAWTYLHQGGRHDTVSGLYNFRNRDYSPTLGRWMQQDPAGYVDGGNLYEYVKGGPVERRDPNGMMTRAECIAAFMLAAGTAGAGAGGLIGGIGGGVVGGAGGGIVGTGVGPGGTVVGIIGGGGVGYGVGTGSGIAVGGGLGSFGGYLLGLAVCSDTSPCDKDKPRKRGKEDPPYARGKEPTNPGKGPDGKCLPCPPASPIWTHSDGSRHQIVWRQGPDCTCWPSRIHVYTW